MQKTLDFTTKANYARRLSALALDHAIRDCRRCIEQGVDPDYYRDELSVYQQEITRRQKATPKRHYDVTGKIIAYEDGRLSPLEYVKLFSHLVKTGLAWNLQGHYGRTAAAMIEGGLLNENGRINHSKLNEVV